MEGYVADATPGYLRAGVPVVSVLNLVAFAEQSICLIEEEDRRGLLAQVEYLPKVFLGLTGALADDPPVIDPVNWRVYTGI